jgi:hypothetical protein
MTTLTTQFSQYELKTILGTFDTSGPCIFSYPTFPFMAPYNNPKLKSLSTDDYMAYATSSHIFPLSYEPGPGIYILYGPTVLEQLANSGTLAHELYHLLNLCSSPFGHFLHLSRMILNIGFQNMSGVISAGNLMSSIKFPLINDDCVESLKTSDVEIVDRFRSQIMSQFLNVQRALLGKLDVDIDDHNDPFRDMGGGHKPIQSWYEFIDSFAKTDLADCLDHIRPQYTSPLFKLAKTGVSGELGGLQIAECIAHHGELLWLNFIDQFYFEGIVSQQHSPRDYFGLSELKELDESWQIDVHKYRKMIKQHISKRLTGDAEYIRRYQSPERVIQQLLGPLGAEALSQMDILFICWMALMTPIDPRTLHLVKKYQMQWEDIQPGYRLLKIVQVIAQKRLFLDKGLSSLRTSVNDYFDDVASELGWPDFKELSHAMSVPHACESKLKIGSLNDPFIEIYEQINRKRETTPWCDILPGPEMTRDDPVFIPLVIRDGRLLVSVEQCGNPAFVVCSFSKISELCIFGTRDATLHALFRRGEEFRAAHESIFDWDFDLLEMEYKKVIT